MRCLADIRAHLSMGSSKEAWHRVCHVLEASEASEREMLLEYVAEHTKDWDASLRRPLYVWWERYHRGEATGYEGAVGDWSGYVWEQGKTAGEARRHRIEDVDIALRWVPSGSFLMGAPEREKGAPFDEKPQRDVLIRRGFWVMETPVTQGLYEVIMGENPSHFTEMGWNAPVEQVNWFDAALFANRLSALEGLEPSFVGEGEELRGVGDGAGDYVGSEGWRLLTEAEWEYVCRAGSKRMRYGKPHDIAWFNENAHGGTHLVGEKEANRWGVKDMLGNVWEWCYDWYSGSHVGLSLDGLNADPVMARVQTERVRRGGSWYNHANNMRCSFRFWQEPMKRDNAVGFRLLRL
ncbi:MAG: formylglycine-generating enzyme family protein [Myxococcales bacterium]|nr:formylglycine-generating enzyme family protein [Myxococcales bacterium]